MSNCSAISQCGFNSKSKLGNSPHVLISMLSSSPMPTGVLASGIFGIVKRMASISAFVALASVVSSFISWESFRISAIVSVASCFAFLRSAICCETWFWCALRDCVCVKFPRQRASNSTNLSNSASVRRSVNIWRTSSVFSRINLRSITAVPLLCYRCCLQTCIQK